MAKEQRRKRRKFSEEYKAETVRLIQGSGKSVGQMALELGIGETALRRWCAQAEVEAGCGAEGALTRSERAELVELRRENRRLQMEREILKKATPSSPRRVGEVRLCRDGEGQLSGGADVPSAGSIAVRILCMARAAGLATCGSGPATDLGGERDTCGESPQLREPGVHVELRQRGQRVGRKRVARLMRAEGLRARTPRRFRCTTDSGHATAIKGNLLARRFAVARPNLGWVADITYL